MSVIAALNWAKDDRAILEYVRHVPSHIIAWSDVARFRGQPGVLGTQELAHMGVTLNGNPQALHDRSARILERVRQIAGESAAAAYTPWLETELGKIGHLVEALDEAHRASPLSLVVLGEDVTSFGKAAAQWAHARSVPSIVLSHSVFLGRAYTVHADVVADSMTLFGPRGSVSYVENGIPANRMVLTGNPAWDCYASLVPQKPQIRNEVRKQLGLPADAPLVVFATTWSAYLTTCSDPNAHASSLEAVARAVKSLRDRGIPVALIVKERPSNDAVLGRATDILSAHGIDDALVMHAGLAELLIAADVAISVDSNVSVEAAIARTPAINIWYPQSWYLGPFFDAADGVLEASPEKLANALARILTDPGAAEMLRTKASTAVASSAINLGGAAAAVARRLLQVRKITDHRPPRFVWEELAHPRSAFEKGGTAEYYEHARPELLNLMRHEPRFVLDVGCGGGATGALLKQHYPNAHVTGVEMNPEAADIARRRIDRLLEENVERLDFEAVGFAAKSIDVVFFPDVLEHLYDPWHLVRRLKPFLSDDCQVLASIPNVRNFWLMSELARGNWDYVEEGLLDVTHIRFFTRKGVVQFFEQTGYRIERWGANYDPRVPVAPVPAGVYVDVDTPLLSVRHVTNADVDELRTIQFLVDAVPNREN